MHKRNRTQILADPEVIFKTCLRKLMILETLFLHVDLVPNPMQACAALVRQ